MSKEIEFLQRHDKHNFMQYVNNESSVLHCHHYTTLFIKLAQSFQDIGGIEFLKSSMEESFFLVLRKYFVTYRIENFEERFEVAEELFKSVGLGSLRFLEKSEKGGVAVLDVSHVDEGWKRKCKESLESVNFMSGGYIQAAFEAVYNKWIDHYTAAEVESIAKGDSRSRYTISVTKEG